MKTKFSEKLNIRKKDKLIEFEITDLNFSNQDHDQSDWYYFYLSRRSAKLLIQKLQKLIE